MPSDILSSLYYLCLINGTAADMLREETHICPKQMLPSLCLLPSEHPLWGKKKCVEVLLWVVYYHLLLVLLPSYIHPKMWKNLVAMETAIAFALCWEGAFCTRSPNSFSQGGRSIHLHRALSFEMQLPFQAQVLQKISSRPIGPERNVLISSSLQKLTN